MSLLSVHVDLSPSLLTSEGPLAGTRKRTTEQWHKDRLLFWSWHQGRGSVSVVLSSSLLP